jgi:hypothetical protein
MTRGRLFLIALIALGLGAVVVHAQRGRFGNRFGGGFDVFNRNYFQNEPPEAEFVMARWHYTAGRRGGGWAHDYPTAEEHILQIMHEATGINTERLAYRVVELGSPEIFQYPFSYVSEPGEMDLTEQEVVNLREYINRGGFVMIDDFGDYGHEAGGDWEFQWFRQQMLRVFPDREMFILTDEHPLLNIFYHIDSIQTVHPMTGIKSIFYGYPDEKGGLAMIVCYANDVGDYWEFIDSPHYAVRPSAEALKLGINFVMYAMTH